MAILQGSPIQTGGVHPYVQLMQIGQQGIDRGIQLAARAAEQGVATSNQFIRDALQQNLEFQRQKLEKERMAQSKELQERQLSLQERQMGQRASEFAQTMAIKQEDARLNRAIKEREVQIAGIRVQGEQVKAAQNQRMMEFQERILGEAFRFPEVGPMPTDGMVLPPRAGTNGEEFGYEGMPPSLSATLGDDTGPEVTANQAANYSNAALRAIDMQIRGNVMQMASKPSSAGYYYAQIGALEAKKAELLNQGQALGASVQDVYQMVDDNIVPGSGFVQGPATEEQVASYLESAPPALNIAVTATDEEWNTALKSIRESINLGDTRNMSDIYETRNALKREVSARDAGLASARFLAEQKYKTPGSRAVQALVDANPYWQRITTRLDQLDTVIGDGPKAWGEGPSQSELLKLEEQASLIDTDRRSLASMESQIQNQWRLMKGSEYNKKHPVEVGTWDMYLINPKDEAARSFNSSISSYQKAKARLEAREENMKRGISILNGKNYVVSDIHNRVFGYPPERTTETLDRPVPQQTEDENDPWFEPGDDTPSPLRRERTQIVPGGVPGGVRNSLSRGILKGFDSSR